MFNYMLEEQQPFLEQQTKQIIKTHFIKKKQYKPFDIDSSLTKKKLSYSKNHPIAHMTAEDRAQIWKSYQKADNFYKKIDQKQLNHAKKLYEHCRDKIKVLSKEEVANFVHNFRSERSYNMGEVVEYERI